MIRNLLIACVFLCISAFPVVAQVSEEIETGSLVLGGLDDGEGMILFPLQVEEGPDGNLYVLDSGDSFIKVYSPAGEYLNRIGGPGEGPGEFQRTDGASFGFTAKNQLYFTEFIGGHHWITILELNGDLVRVLSPQLEVIFGVEGAWPVEDGGFLIQFAYHSKPHPKGDYYLYDTPQSLARVDSLGVVVSEIARTDHAKLISYKPDGATTNLPFTPEFAWAATGNDEVIWSDGMSPRLRVLSYSGHLIREIETQLPQPAPVSQEDIERWRESREERISSRNPDWWARFGRVIEEYKKPLYDKPILREISTTPGGHLLVEGSSNSEAGKSIYWLIDAGGEVLSSVTVAAWDMHFSDHYQLFFTLDEEELPLVHVVDLISDEVAALAQMKEMAEFAEE